MDNQPNEDAVTAVVEARFDRLTAGLGEYLQAGDEDEAAEVLSRYQDLAVFMATPNGDAFRHIRDFRLTIAQMPSPREVRQHPSLAEQIRPRF